MKNSIQILFFFFLWMPMGQTEIKKNCDINSTNVPIINIDEFKKMIKFLGELEISWEVNNANFGSKEIWEAFRLLVFRGFEKSKYEK